MKLNKRAPTSANTIMIHNTQIFKGIKGANDPKPNIFTMKRSNNKVC